MIRDPGVHLRAELTMGESTASLPRSDQLLKRVLQHRTGLTNAVRIDVDTEIPAHQGLGSGTQLAMAIAEAVSVLNGEVGLDCAVLARMAGRGARSAIGLHGYFDGGFLVDAGHRVGEEIGQIAASVAFPDDWRVMLVSPPEGQGISGADESQSFAQIPPMSLAMTGELCRLVLTEILPAIRNQEFVPFVSSMDAYGQIAGEFFADIQGGVYASPDISCLVDRLRSCGIAGIVQSSWGPSIAIFAANAETSKEIQEMVQNDPFGRQCRVKITTALNASRQLLMD